MLACIELKGAAVSDDIFGFVGETIHGKYRVDAVVGEGGFGVVYRGFHSSFEQPIAIKCLKIPSHFTAEARTLFLTKFREEGKHLARLSQHGSVTRVYDFAVATGPAQTAVPYLVLEWLNGRDMEGVLAERRQSPYGELEALRFLRPAIDAIAFAHESGIAHRDLKPANLFWTSTPRGPLLKVLDFGIAKVMQDGDTATALQTKTSSGFSAFSPGYGAPEQFNSKAYGVTGPWTDVHALGLILTEMVIGRPALASSNVADLFQEATGRVRPTPRRHGGIVSDAFEQLCARAMSQRPADRFASAGELLRACDALLAAAARPPQLQPSPPGASVVATTQPVDPDRSTKPITTPISPQAPTAPAAPAPRHATTASPTLAQVPRVGRASPPKRSRLRYAAAATSSLGAAALAAWWLAELPADRSASVATTPTASSSPPSLRGEAPAAPKPAVEGPCRKDDLAGCKARCAQGDGDSCANVAYLYESNRYGVKPDKALAAEYFSKACDLGRAASCTTIGLYYDVGIGVDKNYGKAATLFQKACDGGHPSGCESLADLYVAGRGVDKNGAKAVALYEPICRTWSQACWKLGAVYEKGDVVPRNDAAAAKYYSLGCDDKPKFYPSCYAAGTMYERGHGVARSKPRALEYYRIACHQGRHREACEKL